MTPEEAAANTYPSIPLIWNNKDPVQAKKNKKGIDLSHKTFSFYKN